MDKSEKRFERDIESFLISPEGGYTQFCGQDAEGNWVHTRQHDVSKCIYMDVLCEFIAKTQPKEWAKYTKYYGASAADKLYHRLETTISNQGLLYVLRNGIEDMGCKLKVCFFKPESNLNPLAIELYEANILGCARQFRYTTANTNTIDMVLSVNGIPVVALELKNQLTGQDYVCAINQFKHDRSSKEFAFRLNHRFLVYFAVDLYEAWMTTRLADGGTRFLPFNQGSNGAGVTGGAGNPQNPNGYATSYLWEEVLQRDSLLDLIHRFISFVKEKEEVVKNGVTKTVTKEKMIFPRYHQYDVVRKIMADVRENGVGTNYLIQHSAGSGKSNSIAWIAYRLASVHDVENNGLFDSVIVVTNRVVLDSQLQDTINSFEHQVGLVEAIDDKKNSRSLAEAINDKKRIIICTIQKFLFAKKDMEKFRGRKFAIIIDEAHQGQNGESAKSLRRSLIDIGVAIKEYAEEAGIEEEEVDLTDEYINAVIGQGRHDNQSFFAFTATPKGQTLESFGTVVGMTPEGEPIKAPFHVYSMRQAIEEGYILDVLANYTTVKEAFRLIRVSEDNPELIEGQASRALFKYYKQHGYTIAQKTEMIMTNFLENCRYQIGGKGKAMVVADSRANAVRYYLAIKKYLADHADQCVGCDVMVAFSGEVTLDDYPSEKPFTEATMNLDENGKYITTDKKFRKAFHSSQYNILVVANKYQTGFDEPLLHTMYVDKPLSDIKAVQTLSRLNRAHPQKYDTFVLDFANDSATIVEAFSRYYRTTLLSDETDPNKLYDLIAVMEEYQVFTQDHVEKLVNLYLDGAERDRLDPILDACAAVYKELDIDGQIKFKSATKSFVRTYGFLGAILPYGNPDWEKLSIFLNLLIPKLPSPPEDDFTQGILEAIDLDSYRLEAKECISLVLQDEDAEVAPVPTGQIGAKKEPEMDLLSAILTTFNDMFGNIEWNDADNVRRQILEIPAMVSKDERYQNAMKNSDKQNARIESERALQQVIFSIMADNMELFKQYQDNPDFKKWLSDLVFNLTYNTEGDIFIRPQ